MTDSFMFVIETKACWRWNLLPNLVIVSEDSQTRKDLWVKYLRPNLPKSDTLVVDIEQHVPHRYQDLLVLF